MSANAFGREYDQVPDAVKSNNNKIAVNKWVLLGGIIFACLAIVAVGLGVYFGTKPKSTVNPPPPPPTEATSVPTETTSVQSPTTSKPSTTTPAPDIRLPQTLFPNEYTLTIQAFIPSPSGNTDLLGRNFTFDGNLTIDFHCNSDTDIITLQMHQIDIHSKELMTANGDVINLHEGQQYDNVTQKLVFQLISGSLKAGEDYILTINYTGYLNDELVGFYRSNYYEDGQLKWLAITQFEPTDARRALPCFDEPSFKANFSLTLIHPSDMKALSNAMEESITTIGETYWAVTQFATTPKMSTYLFAMCVAEFESMEATSNNGVLFRVWARHSFVQDAWYAVEMGPKVLDQYTTFFNISFPLVKQDMLAIPDLAFGGMENWGMITYRERDILLDNNTYAATNLQRTATVIAHELAHMWFGDLVTLAWWDDLWLNEGFAEFFEYYGADIISDGDFQMSDQFVPLEIGLTMQLDQLTSSHPIYDPALVTPDEINAAFDDISYDKGACIIRMLNQTVGLDTFRAGLIYYLKHHEYSNADHQDLWNAVQWAVYQTNETVGWTGAPLDVTALMNPWVLQMNFPLIQVIRTYDSNSASMNQTRFLLPGNFTGNPSYENPEYNFTWYVPIWHNQYDGVVSNLSWVQPYKTSNINQNVNVPFEIPVNLTYVSKT